MNQISLKLVCSFILLSGVFFPIHTHAREVNHRDSIYLREFGINTGYRFASFNESSFDDSFSSIPLNLRFGFDINSLVGLEEHKGTLTQSIEPFIHGILDPKGGVEVGVSLMLKYSYPVLEKLDTYFEFGSGPMYFGIKTFEQGQAGFNFLNQGGVGIQYFFEENKAFNLGYRYWHISHNGYRDSSNNGINGSTATVGISMFY